MRCSIRLPRGKLQPAGHAGRGARRRSHRPVRVQRSPIGLVEFVALMATLTALVALSIDMVLPALPAIGASLGVERANDNQLILSLLFLGFGLGQLGTARCRTPSAVNRRHSSGSHSSPLDACSRCWPEPFR